MKGPVKMAMWVLALVMGLGMGFAQAATPVLAQAGDPVAPVAVVDAFHAAGDDIEAALALLTSDVVIELRPPPPNTTGKWTGKEEARKFFEWKNAGKQRRVRAGDAQVSGDAAEYTATGNVGVESDLFTRLGLGTVGHTFRAVVVDGKLKSYLGQLDPKEQPRVAAALLAAQQGQPTDPASVVTTYIREYPGNAALEFLSDDAVVMIVPPPPGTSGVWTGKEEIRTGLFPFAQSQNTRPEIIGSPVVEGNKVTVRVMVQTNDFRRLGVGPVEHTNEAVVEGGKIKSFISTMILSERERIGAAVAARQAQAGQPQPPAGMPRTGDEQPVPFFLIIMSGMLAALVGLALRRDTRSFTG